MRLYSRKKKDLKQYLNENLKILLIYKTFYGVYYSHRYNNSVPRNKIIEELASKVASLGEHTVDLSGGAKMTIIVEVVKNVCCLSVVRDYNRFYKFNLLSVCGQPEKKMAEGKNGKYFVFKHSSNI